MSNSILEKARRYRAIIEKAVSAGLDDETAIEAVTFFPAWKIITDYKVGDRIKYKDKLYKVVQAHTSQADWTPDVTPSLFVEVSDPAIEWPDWKQPTGAHDAYNEGDKVSHNDKHWISSINANVYEPGVYGWTEQ